MLLNLRDVLTHDHTAEQWDEMTETISWIDCQGKEFSMLVTQFINENIRLFSLP